MNVHCKCYFWKIIERYILPTEVKFNTNDINKTYYNSMSMTPTQNLLMIFQFEKKLSRYRIKHQHFLMHSGSSSFRMETNACVSCIVSIFLLIYFWLPPTTSSSETISINTAESNSKMLKLRFLL